MGGDGERKEGKGGGHEQAHRQETTSTNFSSMQLTCSLACMMMSNMLVSLCITARPLTKSASSPGGWGMGHTR